MESGETTCNVSILHPSKVPPCQPEANEEISLRWFSHRSSHWEIKGFIIIEFDIQTVRLNFLIGLL